MKKRIALVAALLGAIFAFAGNAMAAPTPVYCSDSNLQGTTINKQVVVPANTTCDLSGATVNGGVTVYGTLWTHYMTTFNGNVNVMPNGQFYAVNWGDTINGSLSFTDPATYSYNGFFGNYSPTLITGQLNYTITNATNYPPSQAPMLYFGGGVTVNGNFTFSDQGQGQHRVLDQGGLTVLGHTTISS
jgi:hypothetical protein